MVNLIDSRIIWYNYHIIIFTSTVNLMVLRYDLAAIRYDLGRFAQLPRLTFAYIYELAAMT